MNKKFVLFLITFLLLINIPLVHADKIIQSGVFEKGYDVVSPPVDPIYINTPYTFQTFVYNASNGYPLTEAYGITCEIELYNKTGNELVNTNLTYNAIERKWQYTVLGGNFSVVGYYTALISCYNGGYGGYVVREFLVNKTGQDFTVEEALIYLILALGVFLLFALSFYFMLVTPYSNKIDTKGAIIQITKLKYAKLGLILLSWALLTWLLNILIGLSNNFATLTMYYGFFGFIFQTMVHLTIPVGLTVLVIAIFEIIKDVNIHERIKKFGSSQ